MSTATCKHCGIDRYEIRFIYMGQRQKLLIVHCGECGSEFFPVVVDYFAPNDEINSACESAWNAANATKSEVLRINGLTAESAEQREQGQGQAQAVQWGTLFTWDDGTTEALPNEQCYPDDFSRCKHAIPLYTTAPTPPAGVPDEVIKDAEKRGYLEALHDLAFRAANHWHGIPVIDASMKKERDVVMAWCEEAEKELDASTLPATPQPAAQTQDREEP